MLVCCHVQHGLHKQHVCIFGLHKLHSCILACMSIRFPQILCVSFVLAYTCVIYSNLNTCVCTYCWHCGESMFVVLLTVLTLTNKFMQLDLWIGPYTCNYKKFRNIFLKYSISIMYGAACMRFSNNLQSSKTIQYMDSSMDR